MRTGGSAAATALSALISSCNMDSSPAVENPTTGLRDTGTKLVPAQRAIQQAELAGTDLGSMNDAEVAKVVQPGPHCSFSFVAGGKPVLIAIPGGASGSRSYVKLHGNLVELTGTDADLSNLSNGAAFRADGMRVAVAPLGRPAGTSAREADLVFELQQGLRVGYGGFYTCSERGVPQTG